jgi:hypothetical protein
MSTDNDSNSDMSLPSFATLDLFWDHNDEEGGINIDNTIVEVQFDVLQGRAPHSFLSRPQKSVNVEEPSSKFNQWEKKPTLTKTPR